MKNFAKAISIIFHPVLMPTWAYLALFFSGYYFSMLSWEVKRFVLVAVFFSTGLLPLLTMAIFALNPRFDIKMEQHTSRVKPLFFTAIYYYLGFFLLRGLAIYPVFRVFLLASAIVIVVVMVISFKWKISNHMAAIGGATGALLAISFRMGLNPVLLIIGAVFISGLVGSARLYLQKHNPSQVVVGYFLGFAIMYLAVYFI